MLHLVQVLRMPAPQILPDETGYLGNARYLASGYGRNASGYFAGYSLFLLPAARLTPNPLRYYHFALVTNAVMSAISPLLAFLLVRTLQPRTPRWVALVTAGLVAFAPLAFYFVGLTMSENALLPTTLAITLLLAYAARNHALWARFGAATAGAFAYWISPRGLLVVGATLLALALLTFDERRSPLSLVPEAALLGVLTFAGRVVGHAVNGSTRTAGYDDLTDGLQNVLRHPGLWPHWLGATLGRFAYLGVASAGLTIVGLIVALGWLASRRPAPGDGELAARRSVALFVVSSIVVTVVADAARVTGIPGFDRIDHLYFGRYNEVLALPAIVIGAGWLLSRRRALHAAALGVLVGAAVAAATLGVRVLIHNPPPNQPVMSASVPGWLPIHAYLNVDTIGASLLVGAAIATAALVLIAWQPRVFAVVLLLVVAPAVAVSQYRDLQPASAITRTRDTLTNATRVLAKHGVPTRCVEFDHETSPPTAWYEYNDRFLLPKTRFVDTQGERAPNCGPLVFAAGLAYGTHNPAALLVAAETGSDLTLWVDTERLDPRVRADIVQAGLVNAANPCVAMPAVAYDAHVHAVVSVPAGKDADAAQIRVSARHVGAGAPWLGTPANLRADRCGQVDVVATVLDAKGHGIYQRTIPLPHSVLAGENIDVHGPLADPRRPASTFPVQPGHTYRVRIALVQQGIRTFGTVVRTLKT